MRSDSETELEHENGDGKAGWGHTRENGEEELPEPRKAKKTRASFFECDLKPEHFDFNIVSLPMSLTEEQTHDVLSTLPYSELDKIHVGERKTMSGFSLYRTTEQGTLRVLSRKPFFKSPGIVEVDFAEDMESDDAKVPIQGADEKYYSSMWAGELQPAAKALREGALKFKAYVAGFDTVLDSEHPTTSRPSRAARQPNSTDGEKDSLYRQDGPRKKASLSGSPSARPKTLTNPRERISSTRQGPSSEPGTTPDSLLARGSSAEVKAVTLPDREKKEAKRQNQPTGRIRKTKRRAPTEAGGELERVEDGRAPSKGERIKKKGRLLPPSLEA